VAIVDVYLFRLPPRFLGNPESIVLADPPAQFAMSELAGAAGNGSSKRPKREKELAERARQRAQTDFHGDDLRGEDGPLARVGFELALLYREHENCLVRACTRFAPSNAALQIDGEFVLVDVIASGDPKALESDLARIGMREPKRFAQLVSGFFPIGSIPHLAALGTVRYAQPAAALARAPS
jgi:hypothetical protein